MAVKMATEEEEVVVEVVVVVMVVMVVAVMAKVARAVLVVVAVVVMLAVMVAAMAAVMAVVKAAWKEVGATQGGVRSPRGALPYSPQRHHWRRCHWLPQWCRRLSRPRGHS